MLGHWKSEVDCEMAELLVNHYLADLDEAYLERKAALPKNDILEELHKMKERIQK